MRNIEDRDDSAWNDEEWLKALYPRIKEWWLNIAEKRSFRKQVEQLRTGRKKYSEKQIEKDSHSLIKKFNVPLFLNETIQEYLATGELPIRPVISYTPLDLLDCAIYFDRKFPLIEVRPGAAKNNVKKAIEDAWFIFEIKMKYLSRPKHKRLKIRLNRERDLRIFALYEMGVIRYNGEFERNKVRQYFKEKNIKLSVLQKTSDILQAFRELGLLMPSSAIARKKIIQRIRG